MIRRLMLLNGLAILAVVSNHACYWGFTAMFFWTYRYLPTASTPNFDQIGTLSYYSLMTVIKLAEFNVPAFLFVSGFFLAYASRGDESTLSWKMVGTRITNLLVPYLIWSTVIFLTEWLESCIDSCKVDPAGVYLTKLALGQATPAYYYIILISQFYLLAPFLVRFAKTHWKLALIVSAIIQLGAKTFLYLKFFGLAIPGNEIVTMPHWFFNAAFYVTLGIVAGFRLPEIKQWITQVKWGLLVAAFIFGVSSIIEGDILYRLDLYKGGYAFLISTTLFAVTFILCFLAFENVIIPHSKTVSQLGAKSYGIYLIHPEVLMATARVIYHVAPLLLAYQVIYQSILISMGVGIPFLLMWLVTHSRMRNSYRYLFG